MSDDTRRERVLELLEEHGGVTEASVRAVSKETGVPEADIWGAGLFYSLIDRPGERVRVCDGLSCRMAGSEALLASLKAEGRPCEAVSCLAQCDRAPAILREDLTVESFETRPRGVTPDDDRLPMNLGAPRRRHEYAALAAMRGMQADDVLQQIETSGLQGRGGAGFPAHIKWRAVRSQPVTERYVVCNADEGEPGTFKDREVMLRRPELMLEGLAIAAEIAGARQIWLYIRGEFVAEREAVEREIEQAGEALAAFEWKIVKGHGAYICGEETALLESLEGKRGMPRLKPPFPTESGLWGKPTLIHNVETIACVPAIILRGGEAFRAQGRAEAGSKLYSISGHVQQPGVYEMPLGVTLDELVEAAGGYLGSPAAFSPGGASSGFLPISMRDVPLDYRSLAKVGSMLGSAGVVVLDDTVDLALAAKWQTQFFEDESCGQCAPCRIGTRWLHRAMTSFLDKGDPSSLALADEVGWEMECGSICGLGMVAAKPYESARKYFPEAFGPRAGSEE